MSRIFGFRKDFRLGFAAMIAITLASAAFSARVLQQNKGQPVSPSKSAVPTTSTNQELAAHAAAASKVLFKDDRILVKLTRYAQSCGELLTGKAVPNIPERSLFCYEMAITDTGHTPLTAWAATIQRYTPDGSRLLAPIFRGSDAILQPAGRPLFIVQPRDTHRVRLGNPDIVEFKAALFSDGSSSGDPRWADYLVQNRKRVYQDIVTSFQKLSSNRREGTSQAVLVQEFQDLEQKEEVELRRNPSRLMAGMSIFGSIARGLQESPPSGSDSRSFSAMLKAEWDFLDGVSGRLLNSKPAFGADQTALEKAMRGAGE